MTRDRTPTEAGVEAGVGACQTTESSYARQGFSWGNGTTARWHCVQVSARSSGGGPCSAAFGLDGID